MRVWFWHPASGGNGHYYEYVTGNQTWTDAKTAAEGKSHLGVAGHLVTITSGAEQAFVNTIRTDSLGLPDWRPWIGLSDAASEGNYQWVTGEPWRNLSIFFLLLSMLTPTTTRPCSAYFSCSRSSTGISSLHGAHHEAQKSTTTTFPLSSVRSTFLPC